LPHRRAFCFKPTLYMQSFNLLHRFIRCNILRPTFSGNATSSDKAVPRLECL
jgi:hypothetical protein